MWNCENNKWTEIESRWVGIHQIEVWGAGSKGKQRQTFLWDIDDVEKQDCNKIPGFNWVCWTADRAVVT